SRDLLISGDRLVADRENALERTLRRHHRVHDLHRRDRALDALDGHGFPGLQRVDGGADHLRERLVETRPLGRRRGGGWGSTTGAHARRANPRNALDHRLPLATSTLTRPSSG